MTKKRHYSSNKVNYICGLCSCITSILYYVGDKKVCLEYYEKGEDLTSPAPPNEVL